MASWKRAIVYGVISWFVPFAISFGLVSPDGQFLVDVRVFKCIMFVTATSTAAVLLVSYFKRVKQNPLQEGLRLGLLWLAFNLMLDVAILVPMANLNLRDYLLQIGLGYLAIPIMTMMVGKVLADRLA